MPKKHWIVCYPDGNRTMLGKDADQPQSFGSYAAANTAAQKIAENNPGEQVMIYECVGVAVAPVAPPKTWTIK